MHVELILNTSHVGTKMKLAAFYHHLENAIVSAELDILTSQQVNVLSECT